MIFICKECESIFNEEEIESVLEFAETQIEPADYSEHCPCCGSEDFEEAIQCDVCGEYFLETELNDYICKDCFIET